MADTLGKKILVVDDEKDLVVLLKEALEKQGYAVICAYDGITAYAAYLRERPDLIILDIMLPKLNGFEVCRNIRRKKKDEKTPIIMLTARGDDVDRIVGRVIGAVTYMTKPFKMKELLSEIKRLLK